MLDISCFWLYLNLTRKTAKQCFPYSAKPGPEEGLWFEIQALSSLAELCWNKSKPSSSLHPFSVTSFPLLLHDQLELFICMSLCLSAGTKHHGSLFFFPLCFIWAVKSSGGIDVNLPSPHRWFAASMFIQHDSLTLKGIAMAPHHPNIGFTNEPVATIVIAFYFSSVTLNYLSLRATSGLFQRYLCVCICVQLLSMWDSIWDDVW